MLGKYIFLIFAIGLLMASLSDAHITADFENPGAYHENKELDGQTWHVHVVPDVDVSWWTYDNGLVAGEWGQDEVVESYVPPQTPDVDDQTVVDPVVIDDPPPVAPEDPIAPQENIDRSSNPQPIETTPASVNTPTQQSVETTDTTESTEVVESMPRRHRSITQPKPLPKLTITHIRLRYKPYTLFVYVQNSDRRFVSGVTLEIANADDTVALRHRFGRSFTPQQVNTRKHKGYISPDETRANNLIAIAGKHVMKSWNHRKETARFRIGVYQFRSRNTYTEDSTIRLLLGDRVIGEHPQPAVMGSPPVPRGDQLATSWASVKKRN